MFILPTDTCYGFAWSFTKEDFEQIYFRKWRTFSKQLAFLVRNYEDIRHYVEISDAQIDFLREYPYPWSFLWKRNETCVLPDFLDRDDYTMISLRVAENCIDANIRDNIQYPLFLTSANISGQPESKTFEEACTVFPWIDGIDGWICDRLPSNIFSLSETGEFQYLRKNY